MKLSRQTGPSCVLLVLAVLTGDGQDLGSANKLFGGGRIRTAAHPTGGNKKPRAGTPSAKAKRANQLATRFGTKPTKGSEHEPNASIARRSVKFSSADEARYEKIIEEAAFALANREPAKAESLYKSARSLNPGGVKAIAGLANIYREQKRWEEAENAYRGALQLDAFDPATRIGLSYVLTQQLPVSNLSARYAEAEAHARKATEILPRSAISFDQLGAVMEARGEIGNNTEAAYRHAIQLDPSYAPAYAHLGRLLRRRGLTEQAKEADRKALEHSTDVGTMVTIAEVLQSELRFADSVPLLREALKADPKNFSALLMLGHALTVTQHYKEAESLLQQATAAPSGYMASSFLASLYIRQGVLELAENALLQAIRTAPAYEHHQLAQAFLLLGQSYTKAGKAAQAKRAYAQAAKLDPDSGVYSGRFKS